MLIAAPQTPILVECGMISTDTDSYARTDWL